MSPRIDPLSHPLLADLPDDILPTPPPIRLFRQGELIFHRGEEGRDVYLIHDGRVVAVHIGADGRETIYGRIGAGAYLGEIAAIDGGSRSLSAYARSDVSVSVLPRATFLGLFDASPVFRMRVLRKITGLVREMNDRNVAMNSLRVEARVRTHLVRLALEADQFRPGGLLRDAPTHAEIAGSIDANREAVSRAVSQLNHAGLIEYRRRQLTIIQPEGLLTDAPE